MIQIKGRIPRRATIVGSETAWGSRALLTAADWQEIDTAFLGHTDPLLGAEVGAQYDALFSRIVNLAPPPIGVGPEG